MRDDLCALDVPAGVAGEWFALEDAFHVVAAAGAGLDAHRFDVAFV